MISIVLLLLTLTSIARCQNNNFSFTAATFQPGEMEPTQRTQNNYTGFVFSFNGSETSSKSPNGMLQNNQEGTNPFLSTLPGDGNGQTLVTLGPCAGNTPHTHPRGSEISYMLYGSIQFGMVEENSGNNILVNRNVSQGETIHIPQGLLHFSLNSGCEPAAFLANFATKDPGVQTIWNSMLQIPNDILNSATGISEFNWKAMKSTYPLLSTPGTGGEACLAACGLNATALNTYTALASTS